MSNNQEISENPSGLLAKLVIYQIVFFNIIAIASVLILLMFFDLEFFWIVNVPIALGTLIINPFILKKNISKCLKKDKEEIKSKVMLAPLIVAAFVASFVFSLGSEFTSGNYMITPTTMDLANTFTILRINWIIMSMLYLAVAEFVAFKANKKIDEWLKD